MKYPNESFGEEEEEETEEELFHETKQQLEDEIIAEIKYENSELAKEDEETEDEYEYEEEDEEELEQTISSLGIGDDAITDYIVDDSKSVELAIVPSKVEKKLEYVDVEREPARNSIDKDVKNDSLSEAERKQSMNKSRGTATIEDVIIIEEITPDADDTMFGFHLATTESVPSIHTSDLDLKPTDNVREIAEYVMDELDFDVNRFFGRYKPLTKRLLQRKSTSSISITSSTHEPSRLYVNEPSTMNLFYAKGELENETLRTQPLTVVSPENQIDAEVQVHLHRSHRRFGRSPIATTQENESQTREMTLAGNADEAEKIFRHIYPLKDDYIHPKTPSRKLSLDLDVAKAEAQEETVDRARVGPKIKWSKKRRVLPPLPQKYYKVESFWTGSEFRGKYIDRQFEHGFYNYPLMSTYESEFHQGTIQTKNHLGLVTFPRGDKFEGNWRRGRHLAGIITFADELEFSPHRWHYCSPPDRRFNIEKDVGVKPAGRTLYNDRLPPPKILPGSYDTGDGIYNPVDGFVTGFNGDKLRTVDPVEHAWIIKNCRKSKTVEERYKPHFDIDRLPCSYSEKHGQR